METKFTITVLGVFVQIFILCMIVITIPSCESPLKLADNQTTGFFSSSSCSRNYGPSSCGSTCGSSECDKIIVPSIEQPPPATQGSPQKPPELIDGDKLPSSTTETGGAGSSGGGGGRGGR